MRTVRNGRGKPVVLTRENYGYGWDDMDWPAAHRVRP